MQVVDLASTSNGNTVVRWAGGKDGRYRTYVAVRRANAPFGSPRQLLPGNITQFVTHGANVTVGSARRGDFLLRTLRRDASWDPTRTVPQVRPGSSTYQLVGNAGGGLGIGGSGRTTRLGSSCGARPQVAGVAEHPRAAT